MFQVKVTHNVLFVACLAAAATTGGSALAAAENETGARRNDAGRPDPGSHRRTRRISGSPGLRRRQTDRRPAGQ